MAEIIRLIANPEEIDPFVIGDSENVVVRLRGRDDAETLDEALEYLKSMRQPYSLIRHEEEDDETGVHYTVLRRKVREEGV